MGNKAGWIIAGAIVVVAVVIVLVILNPSHSEPTSLTLQAGVLELAAPTPPAEQLLDRDRNGSGNAADAYARAMVRAEQVYPQLQPLLLRDRQAALVDGSQPPSAAQEQMLDEIAQLVADGAGRSEFRFAGVHTDEAIEVGDRLFAQQDQLQRLRNVMVLASLAALGRDQAQQAKTRLENLLLMGADFAGERARVPLVLAGLRCQQEAARQLAILHARHLDQRETAERMQAYAGSVNTALEAYGDKIKFLWDMKVLSTHPGDVYNVAENDADRAWRVEAIATLGLLRYQGLGRGDNKFIEKLIARYAASGDPFEAAAGAAARDLTLDEYRSIPSRLNNR